MSRRPPPSCAGEHNSACRSPPGRRCLLSDVGPKAQRLSNPLDLPLARCTGCIGGILVWRCYLFAAQHIFRSSDLSRSQGSGSRKPKGHDHEHRTQVQQLAQVPRNHHRTASHERSRTSRPRHRPQRHTSRRPDRCRLLIASHRIQKSAPSGALFYCLLQARRLAVFTASPASSSTHCTFAWQSHVFCTAHCYYSRV